MLEPNFGKDLHMFPDHTSLYDFIKKAEVLSASDLARAYSVSKSSTERLDRVILALGLLDEGTLLEILAVFCEIPYVSSVPYIQAERAAIEALGHSYLSQNSVFPIRSASTTQRLLISDPLNETLHNEITFLIEKEISFIACPQIKIRELLTEHIPLPENRVQSREQSDFDAERIRKVVSDGPAARFVHSILTNAVEQDGSDIHFEATDTGLRVRLRKNGILHPQPVDNSQNRSEVFARLKVLAGMNVTESRIPQDGRIRMSVSGRPVDFRVSALPTQHGQSIVCRILDPGSLKLHWSDLGFSSADATWVKSKVSQRNGLFLVTGPTGAGKTTTLYTALSYLNDKSRKIITVEDPVEYVLDGIEQVQVREDVGLSFSSVLRSVLRQDPNIIMIGEIRDEITAAMACRAALVGRMVLSTLHTSSAEGAFARLLDLGVPEYLIKDTLIGVIGQDLTPKRNADGEIIGRKLKTNIWNPDH